MKVLESIFRKALIAFSISTFFTASLTNKFFLFYNVSIFTWAVTIILFVLSWRMQKELTLILINTDPEKDEKTFWGKFEKNYPKLSYSFWEGFLTFGSIHLLFFALNELMLIEIDGNRLFLFMIACLIAILFRLLDVHTYQKK